MDCKVAKANIKAAVNKLDPDGVVEIPGKYAEYSATANDASLSIVWATREYNAVKFGYP